ncbi:hypothetical protein [Thomasclavelia sp.]
MRGKHFLTGIGILCLVSALLLPVRVLAAESDTGQTTFTTTVPKEHTVMLTIGEHGVVKVDGVSYRQSQDIQIDRLKEQTYEIIPDDGYKLEKATYHGEKAEGQTKGNTFTFTAPAIYEDGITLAVSFQKDGNAPVPPGGGGTSGGGTSGTGGGAKTGDNMNPAGMMALLVLSGMTFIILNRKKANKKI